MDRISRRQVVRGAAAAAAATTLGAPSVRAQKDTRTLHFVAEADLKVLDPIWNTAYITRNHGYLVYDTLFGTDENGQVKPQMVDRTTVSADGMTYTFVLRDGLKWHDGLPVVSEDCVESLKRWGKKDRFGQLLVAHTAKIVPIDKMTFTLELAERFGPVLEALGKPSSNVPFMMPGRIAALSADEPIKEVIGSGPFKFAQDEWQPGEQVVYEAEADAASEAYFNSRINQVASGHSRFMQINSPACRRSRLSSPLQTEEIQENLSLYMRTFGKYLAISGNIECHFPLSDRRLRRANRRTI
jgi:peptide/nickel transport system substrate-binding protein